MTTEVALTPAASAAVTGAVVRAATRTLVVTGPDIQALLESVSADLEIAPTMVIDSTDMAIELLEMLGRMSTVASAIEAERKERGKPLRDALQWLMEGYSPAHDMLSSAITAGKAKLSAYNRKIAEEWRIAEAAAAEKRRAEAAAAAAAEAAAIAAAAKTLAEASAARDAGSEQVASAMETEAMAAVDTAREVAAVAARAVYTAPIVTGATKVKGASVKWSAEVTDKAKVIVHVASRIEAGDLSLLSLLDVSDKMLNALARMQEANLSIPGVRPVAEDKVAVRKQAVAA